MIIACHLYVIVLKDNIGQCIELHGLRNHEQSDFHSNNIARK